MGNRGRFGKYGEHKRIGRLRDVGIRPGFNSHRGSLKEPHGIARYNQKVSQKARITIRPAIPSDMHYVAGLSRKVFQQYGPYEDILPQWLESGFTVTFMAMLEKKPVGFVMLGMPGQRWEFQGTCELLAIAVEPARQRLGAADILLREILKTATELLVERIVLHTAAQNLPGKKLFEKHGFVPAGIKKAFYPKGQDALMMCKDLFGKGPPKEI